MKRVLVVHPYLRPHGGGQTVAAWALQALKSVCELSLFTCAPIDFEGINRFFGTDLHPGDFKIYLAPRSSIAILEKLPVPAELLRNAMVQRWVKELDRREPFDVVLSTHNEMDFGRRGIQYVHYPWGHLPRPAEDLRWYHPVAAVRFYHRACIRIGGLSKERLRSNLTLANSGFIAEKIRQAHGIDALILPPPVPGGFPDVPWIQRREAFAGIGRLHECKRWDRAIEIVRRVRESGIDARLTLILTPDSRTAAETIYALARRHPWITLHESIPRDQLVRIVAQHRYGIHAMENEHFGIAPAELQLGGCLTFVHRSGGPQEIVGREERLMFRDAGEAVAKILAVMRDPDLQSSLRERAAARAALYTAERFQLEIRRLVDEFPSDAMRRNSSLR